MSRSLFIILKDRKEGNNREEKIHFTSTQFRYKTVEELSTSPSKMLFSCFNHHSENGKNMIYFKIIIKYIKMTFGDELLTVCWYLLRPFIVSQTQS